MTDAAYQQGHLRILNCQPSPPDPGDAAFHADLLALPKAVKLPVQVPLPPGHPWDQDGLGTCVGNGTGLGAVVAIRKATGKWIVSTPADGERLAHDLYHLANPNDPTYQQGTYIRAALDAALKVGVLGADGQRYRIKSYHTLLPSSDIRSSIEASLAAGMIVVTAWRWPENWMLTKIPFDTLPAPTAPDAGGHCWTIWRAAKKHPAAGKPGLRRDHNGENSWGSSFGPGGAAYFDSALETTPRMHDAWVIQA